MAPLSSRPADNDTAWKSRAPHGRSASQNSGRGHVDRLAEVGASMSEEKATNHRNLLFEPKQLYLAIPSFGHLHRLPFHRGRFSVFQFQCNRAFCGIQGDPKFDISQAEDSAKLNNIGKNIRATSRVKGIWLRTNDAVSTLPMPSGFRRIFLWAEVIVKRNGRPSGERLECQVDDILLTLTSYYGDKMIRIDMNKTGRPRWSPDREEK